MNLATGGSTGRQAGSSFKPFALGGGARERHLARARSIRRPSSIDIPSSTTATVWHVTNAEPSGYGSLTLEQATIYSVNTVYAQLIDQLGAAERRATSPSGWGSGAAERVVEPKRPLLPYLSAVLGTNEVNTLEMASAYGTLATGGQHVNPIPVISIPTRTGNVDLAGAPEPQAGRRPADRLGGRRHPAEGRLYGTGTAANIGRPQIGKTGTDQNYANAWFVGAVPAARGGRLGGLPQGQISMVGRSTTRITVFGGTWPARDLAAVHGERGSRHAPSAASRHPTVGYVAVAVDVTQDPYCLPEPLHAAAEHPDPAVHRRARSRRARCTEPPRCSPSPVSLGRSGSRKRPR